MDEGERRRWRDGCLIPFRGFLKAQFAGVEEDESGSEVVPVGMRDWVALAHLTMTVIFQAQSLDQHQQLTQKLWASVFSCPLRVVLIPTEV